MVRRSTVGGAIVDLEIGHIGASHANDLHAELERPVPRDRTTADGIVASGLSRDHRPFKMPRMPGIPGLPWDLARFYALKATVRGGPDRRRLEPTDQRPARTTAGTSLYNECDNAITAHAVAAAEMN